MRNTRRSPLHSALLLTFLASVVVFQNGFFKSLNGITANSVGESGTIGIEYSIDLDFFPFFCTPDVAALSLNVQAKTGAQVLDESPGALRALTFNSLAFPNGSLPVDVFATFDFPGDFQQVSDSLSININNPPTNSPCVAFVRIIPGMSTQVGPDAAGDVSYPNWDIQIFFFVRPGCSRVIVRGPTHLELKEVLDTGEIGNTLCTAAMDPEDDEPNEPCEFNILDMSENVTQLEAQWICTDLQVCGREVLATQRIAPPEVNRPVVTPLAPPNPVVIGPGDSTLLTFSADIADPDSDLAVAEFYVNGLQRGSQGISGGSDSASFDFDFPIDGDYGVTLLARDEFGLEGTFTWDVTVDEVTDACQVEFTSVDGGPVTTDVLPIIGGVSASAFAVKDAAPRFPSLQWKLAVPSRGVSDVPLSNSDVGVTISPDSYDITIDFSTYRLPSDPLPIEEEQAILTAFVDAVDDPSGDCNEASLILGVGEVTCELEIVSITSAEPPPGVPGSPFTTTVLTFEATLTSNDPDIQTVLWEFSGPDLTSFTGGFQVLLDPSQPRDGVTFHDPQGRRVTVDLVELSNSGVFLTNRLLTVTAKSKGAPEDEFGVCPSDSRGLFVFDESTYYNCGSWFHTNPFYSGLSTCEMGGCPPLPPELTDKLSRNNVNDETAQCVCPDGMCTWVFNSVADPVTIATGRLFIKHIDAGFCGPGPSFLALRTYDSKDAGTLGSFGRGFHFSYDGSVQLLGDSLIETDGFANVHRFPGDGSGGFLANSTTRATAERNVAGDYVIRQVGGTTFVYSGTTGFLESIADIHGNTFTIQRNARGSPTKITNPVGKEVLFGTDATSGLVTSMTLPNGDTWTYAYSNDLLASVTDPLSNAYVYTYTPEGRLTQQTDPAGGVRLWEYDTNNRVVRFVDEQAKESLIAYDPDNRRTTYTDAVGETIVYEYDENAFVTRIVKQDGATVSMDWTDNGLLLARTDELSRTTSYTYDSQDLLVARTDAVGNQETWQRDSSSAFETENEEIDGAITSATFDPQGNRLSFTDAEGNTSTATYNPRGQLLTRTDPSGDTTTQVYDPLGDQVKTVDVLGNETTFAYDPLCRVTEVTDPLGRTTKTDYLLHRLVSTTTDALGQIRSTVYDALYNPIRHVDVDGTVTETDFRTAQGAKTTSRTEDALGNVTTFEYDDEGRLTATVNARGVRTENTYDGRGRMVQVKDALGHVTTTVYNPDGTVQKTIDPLGNATEFFYDSLGRQVRVKDALGNETVTVYNDRGFVVQTIAADGAQTTFEHDELGRVVKTTDALGNFTQSVYDSDGQLLETIDARGNSTIFDYDALGRQVKVTDALGNFTETFFDAAGQVEKVVDQEGRETTFEYDLLGRQTKVVDNLGNETITTYNPDGTVDTVTDANGNVRSFVYDDLDRVVEAVDPLGHSVQTAFDSVGNRSSLTDENGNATTFEYDLLNRLTAVVDAQAKRVEHIYDPAGRRVQTTNSRGQVHTMEYDALGRLERKVLPEGAEVYAYDPVGRRKMAANSVVEELTFYDLLGRVENKMDNRGFHADFRYDENGNLFELLDSHGRATTMRYDALNRLTEHTDPRGNLTTFDYNKAGQEVERRSGTRVVSSQSHDPVGRVAHIHHQDPATSTTLAAFDYTYDAVGNRIQETETRGSDVVVTAYSYDDRDQLLGAEVLSGNTALKGFQEITYAYDPAGNRTERVADGTTETYTYDTLNQLLTKDGLDFLFDADGNMLSEPLSPTATQHYVFDSENNLVRTFTESAGGGSGSFPGDGNGNALGLDLGQRVGHELGTGLGHEIGLGRGHTGDEGRGGGAGESGEHLYEYHPDGLKVRATLPPVSSTGNSDATVEDRFWGLGRLLEERIGEPGANRLTVRLYPAAWGRMLATLEEDELNGDLRPRTAADWLLLQDVLGSTIARVPSDAGEVEPFAYTPYGILVEGSSDAPISFTGLRSEDLTAVAGQLLEAQFRHLRPSLGRWGKRDPAGDVDGPNLYRYARNRPLSAIDTTGLAIYLVNGGPSALVNSLVDALQRRLIQGFRTPMEYVAQKLRVRHGLDANVVGPWSPFSLLRDNDGCEANIYAGYSYGGQTVIDWMNSVGFITGLAGLQGIGDGNPPRVDLAITLDPLGVPDLISNLSRQSYPFRYGNEVRNGLNIRQNTGVVIGGRLTSISPPNGIHRDLLVSEFNRFMPSIVGGGGWFPGDTVGHQNLGHSERVLDDIVELIGLSANNRHDDARQFIQRLTTERY